MSSKWARRFSIAGMLGRDAGRGRAGSPPAPWIGVAVGVLQVAQRDDVAVAVLEVLGRGGSAGRSRPGVDAFESSSAQISWRLPVSASITTIGWSGSKERAMSVIGTAPVCANASGVSMPGNADDDQRARG